MKKSKLRVFLSFLTVAVVLVLAMPKTAKFGFSYEKGKEWKYETLFAQFDFPLLKTEDQIEKERSEASVLEIPYFRASEDIEESVVHAVGELSLEAQMEMAVISNLRFLYEKGVASDGNIAANADGDAPDMFFVQKGKRAQKVPSSEVFSLSDARKRLLTNVSAVLPSENVDSVLRKYGIYDLLEPNLIFDSQATELVNAEARPSISPTSGYVKAGRLIVSQGEIITSEVAQMLDSYRKEYEATVGYSGPRILFWLGGTGMSAALVLFLFFSIYLTKPKILYDVRLYYILLIFTIFSVAPLIVARYREDLLYMLPYTLAALYLQAFFRPKLLLPVYMTTLLPLLVFTNNGMMLYVMFILAGVVSIYAFKYLGRGWKQFIVALINFAVLAAVYMAFHWLDVVNANVYRILAYLFAASLLSVLFYPLIYLFEKIFNLVSNSRLIELCDTSNSLIRQLEQKAPGTFHHSIQVMNMCDAAARAIDANPLLVRAGALYHDIGKMNNPQCFVENESLVQKDEANKYHTGLTPAQSAHDIIKHVTDGYEMAQKHRLPGKVSEFIITHHGTSVTSYFYNKYLNEGGSPENIGDFTYPGMKPTSKEQVILMLCDTIEAASRTLKDFSPESCSAFVEKMVESKMSAGQFENADISIKDLGIVKAEIKAYLVQIHHDRIVYPKRNKNK